MMGGTSEGGAVAPPAPPGPGAPPETTSPFAPLPDKSGQPPAKGAGNPLGAAQPKPDAVPKSAVPVEGPAQPGERMPSGAGKPALPPQGDAHLSGVWQTTSGARFRIIDDRTTITVEGMPNTMLQSLSGTLTRVNGKPEKEMFSGIFSAVFTIDTRLYDIDVTITVADPNTLSIRCTNWPTWNSQGKLDKVVLNIPWLRVPDGSLEGPASPKEPAAPAP